jgi:hypothetical protein
MIVPISKQEFYSKSVGDELIKQSICVISDFIIEKIIKNLNNKYILEGCFSISEVLDYSLIDNPSNNKYLENLIISYFSKYDMKIKFSINMFHFLKYRIKYN